MRTGRGDPLFRLLQEEEGVWPAGQMAFACQTANRLEKIEPRKQRERQPALGSQTSPNLRAAEAGRGGLLGNLERNERGPVTHRPVIVLTAAARGRLP